MSRRDLVLAPDGSIVHEPRASRLPDIYPRRKPPSKAVTIQLYFCYYTTLFCLNTALLLAPAIASQAYAGQPGDDWHKQGVVKLSVLVKDFVPNEWTLAGDGRDLVVITGANQGGKSTFLRGVGLAQVMMQCGLFVAAASFSANVCDGIFTHYKREEDASMKSGKLDEELKRMSEIVDHIREHSLLLCNESFAATNEREGSEIARHIIAALLKKRVKIVLVTHLYALAHGLHEQEVQSMMFLRAERRADGERTFKLTEAEPLQTSYGEDLYRRIFLSKDDSKDDSKDGSEAHGVSLSVGLSKVE